ncbi:hypothetical protein ELQ39_07425 [Streptomyces sp. GB4-14]|nr:hypothetical protein [Streptomyces sp. GB4-14]
MPAQHGAWHDIVGSPSTPGDRRYGGGPECRLLAAHMTGRLRRPSRDRMPESVTVGLHAARAGGLGGRRSRLRP